MASRSDPAVAKAVQKEAAAALKRRDLVWGFQTKVVRENSVQMLSVRNSVSIPIQLAKPLPGRWSVHFSWLFLPIPPSGEYELLRSSFGLNVSGLTTPAVSAITSFVRYDVDNGRQGPYGTLGRHLNVWQPSTIDDTVHFPVPGSSSSEWTVEEVLAFFLSESLADDLVGRLV